MITLEQAKQIVRQELKKKYSIEDSYDGYLYFSLGEVGNWWEFGYCGPNGEIAYGGGSIFVSKENGEVGFYCWPNFCHPAEKENKYIPLDDGKPVKIGIA